jgi:hypothetical protein
MANRKPAPWNSYECTGYDNVADKFVACIKHEGSRSITSEDCDNLLSLQSAHDSLSAENAMLREALASLLALAEPYDCANENECIVYDAARAALAGKGGA